MHLDVGNLHRLDNPTPEQIAHHLRNLPADAPFMTLHAAQQRYLEVTPFKAGLLVGWHEANQHRHLRATLETAEAAFWGFLRSDEQFLRSLPWRCVRWFSDPFDMVGYLIAAMVWIAVLTLLVSLAVRSF
jgi:hypothetical protein